MAENCRKWSEHLQESLLGNLGETDTLLLRRHLQACDRCSRELETLRLVQDLGRTLDPGIDAVLPRFHNQVLARIEAESRARSGATPAGFRVPAWAGRAAATAAVAIALLVPFLFNVVEIGIRGPEKGLNPEKTSSFAVTFEKNRLVITWPENGHRTHRIARSTSPDDFSNAEILEVKGNRWVDDEPQPVGTVYYYRVD